MPSVTIAAEPWPIEVELDKTALIIIDMQRDSVARLTERGTAQPTAVEFGIGDPGHLVVESCAW